ncbi:hypothetical protein LZ016_07055 [Sphingomonas sp. SM33]|uniref:Uncharacterized protein n=1 Tax=Sphingomonas telluris TaxID=2907998 RepID=A0ABS9VLL5_9SPHN|nr:hypothetical protein [Sphingomonas telluris]MCH8615856.1 hypothetical protein [Sphingomonas telluris]
MAIGLYLLLNLAVLVIVARASSARGWRLVGMLFLLGIVAGSANNLLEAVAFGVMTVPDVATAAIPALIIFAILAPLAVTLAGRWKRSNEALAEEVRVTLPIVLAVIGAYEILYWSAGTLVFPYIADFYATRRIPPAGLVASLQIVRSLIFVGAAWPLLKSGLKSAPLVLALVYGIIAGVAPLLPDNPYMPPDIRFYHAIETSVSNALFGLIVGWLFTRRPRLAQA